jgi:hypothetical protein
MAFSSASWKSTLLYYYTTKGYIYISDTSTLINTYVLSNIYYPIITIFGTMIDKDTFINYETFVQYSTITRILAPSPSQLPKNKCTCNIPLCNKLDLVLLTINNIV